MDAIAECEYETKEKLSAEFNYDFSKDYLLVTFHAETMSNNVPLDQLNELKQLYPKFNAIFTMSNADNEGVINIKIVKFVQSDPKKYIFIESMGSKNYLSALKHCACVVGNLSSGLIEAPSFKANNIILGSDRGGEFNLSR